MSELSLFVVTVSVARISSQMSLMLQSVSSSSLMISCTWWVMSGAYSPRDQFTLPWFSDDTLASVSPA